MKISLDLDNDVVQAAKLYAKSRSISLGKAVSNLIRRGINAPMATRIVNGLHVVDLPADSPKVTQKKVRRLYLEEK